MCIWEGQKDGEIVSCEFNLDTACVELRLADGDVVAIDTVVAEKELADTMRQCSELDRLIYNRPLEYVQLVLGGRIEEYLKGTAEHRLED